MNGEHDGEHDGGEDPAVDDELESDEELEPIDTTNPDVIGTARRRYGSLGAGLGAAMFAIDQALTGKQKPETVQVQEAAGQPRNLDDDGIVVPIDDVTSVQAPALERRAPLGLNKKPRRR